MNYKINPKLNMLVPLLNLLVLVGYSWRLRLSFLESNGYDVLSYTIPLAMCIFIHFALCLAIGGVRNSKIWTLSAILILIIGAATCSKLFVR